VGTGCAVGTEVDPLAMFIKPIASRESCGLTGQPAGKMRISRRENRGNQSTNQSINRTFIDCAHYKKNEGALQ